MIPDNLTTGDVAIWAIVIPLVATLIASGIVLGVSQWWAWHKRVRAREEQAEAVRAAEFGGLR